MRHRRITRSQVLDAAEHLFLEKGFRATSVQEIAGLAGFTTGAVYSSFNGKDGLFLAVAERRLEAQREVWRQALASATDSHNTAEAMGTALALAMPEPAWSAVFFEFLSYATRDEELRREMGRGYSGAVDQVEDILNHVGLDAGLPRERLAVIIAALMQGLAVMWFADPSSTDVTLFSDAVETLLSAPDGVRSPKRRGPADRRQKPASSRGRRTADGGPTTQGR
jgi:AcrR family transcriptional regulator